MSQLYLIFAQIRTTFKIRFLLILIDKIFSHQSCHSVLLFLIVKIPLTFKKSGKQGATSVGLELRLLLPSMKETQLQLISYCPLFGDT